MPSGRYVQPGYVDSSTHPHRLQIPQTSRDLGLNGHCSLSPRPQRKRGISTLCAFCKLDDCPLPLSLSQASWVCQDQDSLQARLRPSFTSLTDEVLQSPVAAQRHLYETAGELRMAAVCGASTMTNAMVPCSYSIAIQLCSITHPNYTYFCSIVLYGRCKECGLDIMSRVPCDGWLATVASPLLSDQIYPT